VSGHVPFSDLATAAYCPRQLYYVRRESDRDPPAEVRRTRALAFRYPAVLDGRADLTAAPVACDPATYRDRLRAALDRLPALRADLRDPPEREVVVEGRDCRGVVHKVLADGPTPVPSVVSAGTPPPEGVYEPQAVRAVAAAKALSYREETPVERAVVEYPAHGIVRSVALTTRRRATYRRTLRTVRAIDGPPPRVDDDAKCDACDYREECGVRTRSLRSLL
jgi:CRISPR-associated exonuclease Cas4